VNAQTMSNLPWIHRIGGVVHVSVSPDGQLIAAVSSETGAYAFAADGRQLWPARSPASGQGFKSVAISSDGRYLVAGQDDEPPVGRAGVYFYDAKTGNELWSNETNGLVWSVGISSDGKYVVAGSADHHVYFFQRDSGDWLWTYEARLAITSVAISSDGRYIAAAGNDGIYMFDRASERPIWNYSQYGKFYSVSISPDGQYVVGGSLRSVVLIRRDGAVLWNSPIGGDPWAVTISNDSQFVVVGTEGSANEVRLLIRENATTVWHHSFEQPVESVAISIDDKYVVAGGDDHQVHVFNRDTGSYLFNYTTDDKVFSVALPSDGRYVAAGGAGSVICFEIGSSSQSMTATSVVTSSPGQPTPIDFLRDPIWQFIGVIVAIVIGVMVAIHNPPARRVLNRRQKRSAALTKTGPPRIMEANL
jgi:WD40 repeat protein